MVRNDALAEFKDCEAYRLHESEGGSNYMKKIALFFAMATVAAAMLTGCFGKVEPEATIMPTETPTLVPTATTIPEQTDSVITTGAPEATDIADATDGLDVAPSPSVSSAPEA